MLVYKASTVKVTWASLRLPEASGKQAKADVVGFDIQSLSNFPFLELKD